METLWIDARCAWRRLGTAPAASIAVIGVLGLAIGITTAMFTIVDALFLRPVPFEDPAQLAIVRMRGPMGGPLGVPPAVFQAWQRSSAFERVAAARPRSALVATDAGTLKRPMALVTPDIFTVLGGVRAVRGRLFGATDVQGGVGDHVLISEDLWRTSFQYDPAIAGRATLVDGRPVTIVGVVPSDFRFPEWNTALWRASGFDAAQTPADAPIVYARLAAHVPRADALRTATTEARDAAPAYAQQWAEAVPLVAPDKAYRRAVPLFAGGVVLIFLELCTTASSLLLIGLAARRREIETRLALGAPRRRLIRQALFEGGIACAGGVVAGVGIAWLLVAAARLVVPRTILVHTLNALNVDVRALVAASLAAAAALMCACLVPAIVGTRVEARDVSQLSSRGHSETRGARAVRRGLLVGQVAAACTLLLGSILLVRSFVNLATVDRGLDSSGVLIATIVFPQKQFASPEARRAAAVDMVTQARRVPGIQQTSWSYGVPPAGGVKPSGGWTPDRPGAQPLHMEVSLFSIDEEFLALYELPLLQGRALANADPPGSVLVSERFARALWPSESAVGRSFALDDRRRFHVVGVVRDIRHPSLDKALDVPQMYEAYRDLGVLAFLNLRCDVRCPDPTLIQQRLGTSGATIEDVKPLEDKYNAQVAGPRAAAVLALIFAVTALVASAAGIFSLLSHSVARRRREFGIRVALGAPAAAVRSLVWREALSVILPGLAIGTLAGLWLARLLSASLFGIAGTDVVSWAVVIGLLAVAMIAASWRPTRMALRTAPTVLLRAE